MAEPVQTDPAAEAANWERRLRDSGSVARAVSEKAYLKSDLEFAGAVKPLPAPMRDALMAGYRDKIPIPWEHLEQVLTG